MWTNVGGVVRHQLGVRRDVGSRLCPAGPLSNTPGVATRSPCARRPAADSRGPLGRAHERGSELIAEAASTKAPRGRAACRVPKLGVFAPVAPDCCKNSGTRPREVEPDRKTRHPPGHRGRAAKGAAPCALKMHPARFYATPWRDKRSLARSPEGLVRSRCSDERVRGDAVIRGVPDPHRSR